MCVHVMIVCTKNTNHAETLQYYKQDAAENKPGPAYFNSLAPAEQLPRTAEHG